MVFTGFKTFGITIFDCSECSDSTINWSVGSRKFVFMKILVVATTTTTKIHNSIVENTFGSCTKDKTIYFVSSEIFTWPNQTVGRLNDKKMY